ncbi:unnamed protein product [Ilex paraguariensis]|uniref:NPF family transporter n=1 Tax=Ilex paraguariensis TaxID=185542 RepID=A0ABC8V5C9_9AQUA
MESEKNMAQNGEDEKREENTKKKKKLGGMRTMPFIVANEICDRFASAGSHVNLISYLTQELNLSLVKASNTLTYFGGISSFMPLLGALVADSFAGRFWTIVAGSIFYQLGLVSITISAILPQLRPPPCPTQENCIEASSLQLLPLYISFILTSFGAGGIRPCVITFAADQFDMSKSKVATRSWNFFNWYYFSLIVSILPALTVVVYIQDNVDWKWGFGIPTASFVVSIIAFLIGSPLYKKVKPAGSPLTRLAQVIVAAVRKRKLVAPADSGLLYENRELDAAISSYGRLLHTDEFKCLDRAAIVTDEDTKDSKKPNLWRLATVHRVEELKSIIRMLPIWGAGILLVASYSHQYSFQIQQARSMDRHFSHSSSFEIPPASLSIFSMITVLIGIAVYERVFVPIARRFTGNPVGVTCLQRMGIGYAICIVDSIVSALVEVKRKKVAAKYNLLDKPTATIPISVFWMLPQYCLDAIGDVFLSIGQMEFLYDQTPESMRSTAPALYWLALSAGNYIGTFMVSLIHKYTGKENNWIPNRNLNRGRLENYYLFGGGIQVITLIYYVIWAWFYTHKPLEEVKEEDVELAKEDVELAKEEVQPKQINDVNGIREIELARIETS